MRQLGQSVLVLVLLLGAAQLVCAAPLPVDIHVMLDASTVSLAEAADRTLHALLPGDEVFLNTIDMPHVTLYLTQFEADNLLDLIATVGAVVANFTTCTAQLNNATAVGTYGMWMGPASPCLQLMSDSLVNATMQYIVPNQPIPSWINTLPEPLREEKIAMIEKYGSPNVFTQFQPHVTLAWDNTTSALPGAMQALALPAVQTYRVLGVALGAVGPYGTVLRGEDFAQFVIGAPSSGTGGSV